MPARTPASSDVQSVERLLGQLQQAGLRRTRSRRAILKIFLEAVQPLAVPEIMAALPVGRTDLNKTSIYRELETLRTRGFVRELQFGDERQKRYELDLDGRHHHHVRCISCGRIQDVHIDEAIRTLSRSVSRQSGFAVVEHEVEFLGLCPNCAE
jgi:Fe2+ or Zn2+ uptake regulation protein